jgi:hypothetical protein
VRWNEPSDEAAAGKQVAASRNKVNASDRYKNAIQELDVITNSSRMSSFVVKRLEG